MPLPSPRGDEARNDFISRCMDNESVKRDFGAGTEQAQAVCIRQWRQSKVTKMFGLFSSDKKDERLEKALAGNFTDMNDEEVRAVWQNLRARHSRLVENAETVKAELSRREINLEDGDPLASVLPQEASKSDDRNDDDIDVDLRADDDDAVQKSWTRPIIKADDEKQIVYGIVFEPEEEDTDGDVVSADEIEKAAHRFLRESRVIGKEHEEPAEAEPVESWLTQDDTVINGQSVKKGAWIMGVKVHDDGLWQAVKKGEITGLSFGGFGRRVDE